MTRGKPMAPNKLYSRMSQSTAALLNLEGWLVPYDEPRYAANGFFWLLDVSKDEWGRAL